MLIIACISLLALMLLGVPITFSLLGAGFLAVLLGDGGLPMYMNCRGFISGVNSFTLMAIPFFMISGSIMNQGGLSKRIIQFCSSLFSWLRGGVGIVCVAANMIFGAVSGSGTAAVAAIGSITAPDMEKIGYKKEFTGAMIAGAASTAPIIPPSNVMIIFASITGLSITRMFPCRLHPGLAIGLILMVICHFYAKKHNIDYGGKFHLKAVISSLGECLWALLMPLIIIVGITAGLHPRPKPVPSPASTACSSAWCSTRSWISRKSRRFSSARLRAPVGCCPVRGIHRVRLHIHGRGLRRQVPGMADERLLRQCYRYRAAHRGIRSADRLLHGACRGHARYPAAGVPAAPAAGLQHGQFGLMFSICTIIGGLTHSCRQLPVRHGHCRQDGRYKADPVDDGHDPCRHCCRRARDLCSQLLHLAARPAARTDVKAFIKTHRKRTLSLFVRR